MPSYGVVSSSCNLVFNDYDYTIKNLATAKGLKKNIKAEFFICENISKTEQKIGEYFTSKWNYNNNSREVNVTLKDPLEKMQDIIVDGFSFDPLYGKSQNAKHFFDYLYAITISNGIPMRAFNEYEIFLQNQITTFTIPYPFLKQATLWRQWEKFCEALCFNMYWEHNIGKATLSRT